MRLHRLTVTAFGPFAAPVTVDFDALGAGGLFLFHGPTGAGKTSILDAVCFALYGQVPGARQQTRSLGSDHAGPRVRPEVVLEVTLRGRRLRVTRSPAWERPKQRGSGTITEPARVLVEEGDAAGAGWRTRSTRLDESGQLLSTLIGLGREQFCQVVLLPQGQFAEFLRADADRRRDLLEALFDTSRFAAVERWLVDRRQRTGRAVEHADQEIAEILARVEEAAGAERPVTPVDDATPWVAELLAEAGLGLAPSLGALEEAARVRESRTATVAEAGREHELRERRAALLARQAAVDTASARRDRAEAEVQAARQVAPVLPLLTEVGRLQGELDQARSAVQVRHTDLAGFLAATGTGGPAAVAGGAPDAGLVLRSAADARSQAGALRQLADQESEAGELRAAVSALEQAVVSLQDDSQRVRDWLDAAGPRRSALATRRARAQQAAADLPGARARHDRAAARLAAGTRRDQLVARVTAAADALRQATDEAQQARETWLQLRQARLDGMAAELATSLATGVPCPVCGSPAHPAPASRPRDRLGPEHEDRAARVAEEAESAREQGRRTLDQLEMQYAEALRAAEGEHAVTELAADETANREQLDDLARAADDLPEAVAAVEQLDQEREAMVREQVRIAEQLESSRHLASDRLERLRSLTDALDRARQDDPSVASRAARLEHLADECEQLARQAADLQHIETAVAGARQRAEQAAAERGLPSLAAAAQAARPDDDVAELDAFRARHDAERSTVAELLADPALAVLEQEPAVSLDEVRRAAADADEAYAAAVVDHAAARDRVTALTRLQARLATALAERAPLAEQHRVIDALSRLAEGKAADNRLRMSLSAYVLAARLEQVATAASERLARMSGGRYTLVHSAQATTGRARGGLHLRVVDAWTGAERDTASLSGGESFFASLSLALGLADVVAAEAGGSLLETLFVDEGFGSLDDDTLDEVMGVLDGLRDGGRVVGVVSHVADLRQRIPVQLRVDKHRHGSTVVQ